MNISLVICAYNEEKYIGECLASVIKTSHGKFYEIIVIDNASTDRTKEVVLRYPGVRVISEEKKGLTKARERGLSEARGDIIAFVDADTRMPEGWIETALDFFNKNNDVVSLSGPYKYYDGSKFKNSIMQAVWRVSAPVSYYFVGYMILGGNFLAKKKALQDIGGFDTNISFYGEDTDVARRLSKVGRVVFKMNFFIYSSSRRFMEEGLVRTNFLYAMNFIWPVVFKRPFTKQYKDIRISNDK